MVEAIREGDVPGVQLRVRRNLPLDRVRLWPWLVEPQRLARWAAERVVEADAAPGGGTVLELELVSGDASGSGGSGGSGDAVGRERWAIVETLPALRLRARLERLGDGWGAATPLIIELSAEGPGSCELS